MYPGDFARGTEHCGRRSRPSCIYRRRRIPFAAVRHLASVSLSSCPFSESLQALLSPGPVNGHSSSCLVHSSSSTAFAAPHFSYKPVQWRGLIVCLESHIARFRSNGSPLAGNEFSDLSVELGTSRSSLPEPFPLTVSRSHCHTLLVTHLYHHPAFLLQRRVLRNGLPTISISTCQVHTFARLYHLFLD